MLAAKSRKTGEIFGYCPARANSPDWEVIHVDEQFKELDTPPVQKGAAPLHDYVVGQKLKPPVKQTIISDNADTALAELDELIRDDVDS